MNKTFCYLIVISFLFSVCNIGYIYHVNPKKSVQMVVSDTYTYMDSGNSYVKTEYCKVDDPFKCLSKREMRTTPKYAIGTKVQLHISEKIELDPDTMGWLNFLQFVVFIELCVMFVGAFFIGSIYIFVPKVETNRQYLL